MQKLAPGIYRLADGRFRLRATRTDPETGRRVDKQETLPEEVTTLKEAKEWRQKMLASLEPAESFHVADKPLTTVGDYTVLWFERRAPTLKPLTRRNYYMTINNFILPRLADVRIDQLTRAHTEAWVAWADSLRQGEDLGYSVATRRDWWSVLKMILLDLKAECGLALNPVERVRPPKVDNGRRRSRAALTLSELETFVDAFETMVPTRFCEVLMLATTGMRVGECHGLMWDCVDWEGRALHLKRSASKGILTSTTKTGYNRVVPLCDQLARELREHRKRSLSLNHEGVASKLVFPSTAGTPRFSASLRVAMNNVAKALGMEVNVGPQTLRRTMNNLLVEGGASEVVIRSTMGHRSPEMTHLYSSVTTDAKHEVSTRALGSLVN